MTPLTSFYWSVIIGATILVYLAILNDNFLYFVYLKYRIFMVNTQLLWYRWWLNPRNPISKWVWDRRFKKMVKEFSKEK